MFNWLHHLLNPHCPECANERRESKVCDSCEILKTELASLRYTNEQLTKSLLEQFAPRPVVQQDTEVQIPIKTVVPWRVRQQMLENADREKKHLEDAKKREAAESLKSTAQLEEELLGENIG